MARQEYLITISGSQTMESGENFGEARDKALGNYCGLDMVHVAVYLPKTTLRMQTMLEAGYWKKKGSIWHRARL